jgi:hypothetical protein
MELDLLKIVSKAALPLAICFLIYIASLYTYRIFFHPLAQFPGPKLSAISNWYEFYYDVVQQGNFTFHIQELHERYGRPPHILGDENSLTDGAL